MITPQLFRGHGLHLDSDKPRRTGDGVYLERVMQPRSDSTSELHRTLVHSAKVPEILRHHLKRYLNGPLNRQLDERSFRVVGMDFTAMSKCSISSLAGLPVHQQAHSFSRSHDGRFFCVLWVSTKTKRRTLAGGRASFELQVGFTSVADGKCVRIGGANCHATKGKYQLRSFGFRPRAGRTGNRHITDFHRLTELCDDRRLV